MNKHDTHLGIFMYRVHNILNFMMDIRCLTLVRSFNENIDGKFPVSYLQYDK